MKSVIQEASSIAKAVDLAWEKAGKPADFSIKVLELPQKNFFGLTTHSAKVSLCFEERIQGRREQNHAPRQQSKRDYSAIHSSQEQQPRRAPAQQQRQQETRPAQPRQEQHREMREERPQQDESRIQRSQAHWEQPMISFAEQWLKDVLKEMNCAHVTFAVETSNAFLRFTLSHHLIDNPEKEKRMLAGMSLLMLEAIKRNFKAGLRRHRIVLTHNA